MKRVIVVLVALMVLSGSFAFANDDVKMEAGVKIWNNKWKSKDPDPVDGGTLTLDAALMIGPAFKVTLPSNMFFEVSYLISVTDYEKQEGTRKIVAERDDLDIAFGAQTSPEAGFYLGYRRSSLDWKTTAGGLKKSGSFEISGPVIGIRGNYWFSDMFGVYANAAYLMTRYKEQATGVTFTEYDPGTQFELGVKAKFSKELSGTLGYKVESFKGYKSKIEDTFSGLTFGVIYQF